MNQNELTNFSDALEEAYTIHELYRGLELSDIGRISRWQDDTDTKGLGIRIDGFPGSEAGGLVHPFDFAMNTSGCGFKLQLVGLLGKLSLDPRFLPDIFSRLSLQPIIEQMQTD